MHMDTRSDNIHAELAKTAHPLPRQTRPDTNLDVTGQRQISQVKLHAASHSKVKYHLFEEKGTYSLLLVKMNHIQLLIRQHTTPALLCKNWDNIQYTLKGLHFTLW